MKLYDYLLDNYKVNEPIFLYDIDIKGKSQNAIKLEMNNLYKNKKIDKFDRGIYYFSKPTEFGFNSTLSLYDVINKKYLTDKEGNTIGYLTDVSFANNLQLTTQRAMYYTIRTNKATKSIEKKIINNTLVVIKKPRILITNKNYKILQLLDLFADRYFIEIEDMKEVFNIIKKYMSSNKIKMEDLKKYYVFYPERLYKNMYEMGLLNETIK